MKRYAVLDSMCRICQYAHMAQMTGLDLKLARVAARCKQHEVAKEMGVTPSRISALEREAVVSETAAARYLAALDTCRIRGMS